MSDLLTASDEWHFGHTPLNRRLNVQKELRGLRHDPLEPFLALAGGGKEQIFALRNDLDAYEQAYQFYYIKFVSISSGVVARMALSKYEMVASKARRCFQITTSSKTRNSVRKSTSIHFI